MSSNIYYRSFIFIRLMLVIFTVKFEKCVFCIFSLHDDRSFTDATDDTPYCIPHHGYRSFTFVQDDALPSLIILNGDKNTL